MCCESEKWYLIFVFHASEIDLIRPNKDNMCVSLSWYFTFTVWHGKKLPESDRRSITFRMFLAMKKTVKKRLAIWLYKQVVPKSLIAYFSDIRRFLVAYPDPKNY